MTAVGAVVVGRYRLERLVGKGGMGEVFEALDLSSRRRVAIKYLRVGDEPAPELVARFEREIRVMSTISSRHIPGIHDAGRDETTGEPFMVMDMLDGDDLAQLARRLGPLSVELAVRLVAQTCDGLSIAHGAGVIHRDLKPSNLFLAKGPDQSLRTLKILDFGIARIRGRVDTDDLTSLTRTGTLIGSPAYMAPEQLRGSRSLDHRADLWALGVVLYRLLAGSAPHARHEDSLAELMFAICGEPAPAIRSRAPWVPQDLADIVHRALSIPVDGRFATAAEFRAALERWLPAEPITEAMLVPRPIVIPAPPADFDPRAPTEAAEVVESRAPVTSFAPPAAAAASSHGLPVVTFRPAASVTALPVSEPDPSRLRAVRPVFVVGLGLVALSAFFVYPRVRNAIQDLRDSRDDEVTLADHTTVARDRRLALLPPLPSPSPSPTAPPPLTTMSPTAVVTAPCPDTAIADFLHAHPDYRDVGNLGRSVACFVLSGDLDSARGVLLGLDAERRPYILWPAFEAVHQLTDVHIYDRRVGPAMRFVLEFWPDNAMALYHAGLTEYRHDARPMARTHLLHFLEVYKTDDRFRTAARAVLDRLAVLDALPQPGLGTDCNPTSHLAVDPEGHRIGIYGCETSGPSK